MTPSGIQDLAVERREEAHKRKPQQRVCPECREPKVRRSHRRTLADYLLSLAGLRPYRCHECGHRFHARSRARAPQRPKRSRWAQCPRCGFTGVNRIPRDKVPSTWGNLMLRALPVSGYRCPECRKRFFDLRSPQPR